MNQLPEFYYNKSYGPVDTRKLGSAFTEGNCRLAIQLYFARELNVRIPPEKILCPESYFHLGEEIGTSTTEFFKNLKAGDVIFAERIRNSKGVETDNTVSSFENNEKWIINLHSAIYLDSNKVWHATAIEGGTCIWTAEKFNHYYKAVLARRIADN